MKTIDEALNLSSLFARGGNLKGKIEELPYKVLEVECPKCSFLFLRWEGDNFISPKECFQCRMKEYEHTFKARIAKKDIHKLLTVTSCE